MLNYWSWLRWLGMFLLLTDARYSRFVWQALSWSSTIVWASGRDAQQWLRSTEPNLIDETEGAIVSDVGAAPAVVAQEE